MKEYYLINNASRASQYGIGTYVKQVERILKNKKGIKFAYIDMWADVKEYSISIQEGIRHLQIPHITNLNDYQYYRNAAYFLTQHINSKKNIIFHFNYFQAEVLATHLKEFFINSKIIFTIHYFDWCFELNGNYSKFQTIINNRITNKSIFNRFIADKSFLRKFDSIITLSKNTSNILIKEYGISPNKLNHIYNGLDNHFNVSHKRNHNSARLILFVGRLDDVKGVEFIIKSFRYIANDIQNIQLALVGDGNFGKYLSLCENIRDKIIFTGKVAHDKLESIYQNATIGIQPSFHEQCSYSAIEMMKYGIPLIVSDSTGLKEMMEKCPENIIHINEQDFNEEDYINQIAKRMKKLLSDETYRLQVSDKMKEIYTERYTLEKMAESMDKLINITFSKKQPFISEEFLEDLDERMMSLINLRPDIELGFSGLSGIGHYLWWRVQQLKKQKSKESEYRKLWLEEHIIYFLDWLEAVLIHELNNEETFHSNDLQDIETLLIKIKVMHPTQVGMLLNLIYTQIPPGNNNVPPDKTIVSNAIKLYNTQQI